MTVKMVIASHNRHKHEEMGRILGRFGIDTLTPEEAGADPEVEETGETFEENARLKALAVARATGLPAVADDSGLCVEALGGAPGVYSARYGGEALPYAEKMRRLLGELSKVPERGRAAKFVCAICCVFPDREMEITARGECRGAVAAVPDGGGGFGYDPIFIPEGFDKTFARLNASEKDAVSHRGRALADLADKLGRLLAEGKLRL